MDTSRYSVTLFELTLMNCFCIIMKKKISLGKGYILARVMEGAGWETLLVGVFRISRAVRRWYFLQR